MKKYFLILMILCTSLSFYSCRNGIKGSQVTKQSLENYLSYPLANDIGLISVHRGGGELKGNPENCIESFEFFSNQFPVFIECDIAMTKDEQLIMMHDKSVDRTTNGSGFVNQLTINEIKELKLKDNHGNLSTYSIPSLENVLKWSKDKAILTLDVKKSTPFDKVIQQVEVNNAERQVVIITYSADEAKKVFDLNPNLKISVGIMKEVDYNRLNALGIPDVNMIAFIGTREPNATLIQFLHDKGIATILGTLGNLDKKALNSKQNLYKKWQEMGVDIFATDYPIEANNNLKEE